MRAGQVGELAAQRSTRISPAGQGGGCIVLVTAEGGSTVVRTYDTTRGVIEERRRFEGQLDREAFSTDHSRLYTASVLRYYYNVHVLGLTTGQQDSPVGPDKTKPPEGICGRVQ